MIGQSLSLNTKEKTDRVAVGGANLISQHLTSWVEMGYTKRLSLLG